MVSKVENSSRTPIIDIVECIGELIAIQSHLSELYASTVHEIDVNEKEEHNEVYLQEKQEELAKIKEEYQNTYRRRKKMMQILKDEYDANMDYRCLLKHSIGAWQYSKEIRDTDRNNIEYEILYIQASEYMYSVLSHFLWVEVVKCWRCLLDAMDK